MRYFMRQKLLAIGNDFSVTDESGNEKYFIDGKGFTFGQQLSFQNSARQEIGFISQKLMSFRKTFSLKIGTQEVATVRKAAMSFSDAFEVLPNSGTAIKVRGKLFEHEYKFMRNKREIASVSKKWFRASDTYGIDIKSTDDELLILAAAVAIDLCCHNPK